MNEVGMQAPSIDVLSGHCLVEVEQNDVDLGEGGQKMSQVSLAEKDASGV